MTNYPCLINSQEGLAESVGDDLAELQCVQLGNGLLGVMRVVPVYNHLFNTASRFPFHHTPRTLEIPSSKPRPFSPH